MSTHARAPIPLAALALAPAAALALAMTAAGPAEAAPVKAEDRTVLGTPITVVTADLTDPATLVTARAAGGPMAFEAYVRDAHPAAVANGTFEVGSATNLLGTLVANGKAIGLPDTVPMGTTFGLRAGNRPEMLTGAAAAGAWRRHWFSINAGPRLVAAGKPVYLSSEGFTDGHLLGTAGRTALGTTRGGDRLLIASFHRDVSLLQAADVMRALGCHEAMNLDGGGSRALAVGGKLRVKPTRALGHVIAIHDARFPAPRALVQAFRGFVASKPPPPTPDPYIAYMASTGTWHRDQSPSRFGAFVFEAEVFAGGWVKQPEDPYVARRVPAMFKMSQGQAFAPWPTRRPDWHLRIGARLQPRSNIDPLMPRGYTIGFEAAPDGPRGTTGAELLYTQSDPTPGLTVRTGPGAARHVPGGQPEPAPSGWWARLTHLGRRPVIRVPVDHEWHTYDLVATGKTLKVWFDGRHVLDAPRPRPGRGLVLGGHLDVRELRFGAPRR